MTRTPCFRGFAMTAALFWVAAAWPAKTEAGFITFFDQATFLASSFATSEGAIPDANLSTFDFTYPSGNVVVESTPVIETHFLVIGFGGGGDWTTRTPGADIAVDGVENLDFTIVGVPIFSFGFQFVEPENDPNVNTPPFTDSTFSVTLFNSGANLFSFNFNAPNDTFYFVGVSGDQAFDRVEVRELIGGAENEFFGELFTGQIPSAQAIPEPSSLVLAVLGAASALGLEWRRRRRLRRRLAIPSACQASRK